MAILNYGLLILSTVYHLKCESRGSYLNPFNLTTSFRTPNQVKIHLYGDDVFVFILRQDFKALLVPVQLFTFSPKIILECTNGADSPLNRGLRSVL